MAKKDTASDKKALLLGGKKRPETIELPVPMEDGEEITLVFQSIGARAYDELKDAHAPTAEQIAEAKAKGNEAPPWNEDTFFPAVIAAAMTDPVLTVEEVEEHIFRSPQWNKAEINRIVKAAVDVNQKQSIAPFGNG